MFKFLCVLVLVLGCSRSKTITIQPSTPQLDAGLAIDAQQNSSPVDSGASPIDASRWASPFLQRLLTPRLDQIMTDSLADHSRLQTLQALLLATEGFDAPTVVIGPAPRLNYDDQRTYGPESPMLRVTVRYPGRRRVTVDHFNLSLALQQALRLGMGLSANP